MSSLSSPLRRITLLVLVAAAISNLVGCMAHLAPDYDQAIVDGLTKANEQAMTLFASVSSGTTLASPFSAREAAYNSTIGKFDALRLEVLARPVPQPPSSRASPTNGAALGAAGPPRAPSANSLTTIVKSLTQMRNRDKSGPMPADVVALFKNNYELSFSQALTYEEALKR
jgi:hypothetical protein